MYTYSHGDALIVFFTADVELLIETRCPTGVGNDIVLITPLIAQDLGEKMVVGYSWNTIVRVVGRHDGPSVAVHNGTLQGGKVEASQFSLSSMNRGGVDALLG